MGAEENIEVALVVVVALYFMASIYLMLSIHIIRIMLGVTLLSNAVNLLIFTAGRIKHTVPPIIAEADEVPATAIANPLPQALVLTAIVISFSLFAYLLVLAFRTDQALRTDKVNLMRVAEPRREKGPPTGY